MKKFLCFLLFALCLTVAANAQSSCETPTNVTVTPGATSATVSWTGSSEQYNVLYLNNLFYCGADIDDVSGWQSNDADGDGNNWGLEHMGRPGAPDDYAFVSYSYSGSALDPDNWLITPIIDLGGTMSVWMKSYQSYYLDTFAIYLTTDLDFDDVEEDFNIPLVVKSVAPYEWTEYTADLSDYAGQQGYIAIRHFDSYDRWALLMDDFRVDEEIMLSNVSSPAELSGLTPEITNQVQVQAICTSGVSEWSDPVGFTTHGLCDAPSNLSVTPRATTASLEWTGYQDQYTVRYQTLESYNSYAPTVTLTAGDVWGDGTGYQMLLDADATAYGDIIPEIGGLTTSGDASEAVYAEFEYKIPANADGLLNTSNIVLNNSVTISIPAGIYDFCITNPLPGDRMWIATNNGTANGREDNYVFETGKKYEFMVTYHGGGDGVDLTITDNIPEDSWTTVTNVSNPADITGLDPETTYLVQVQGICEDGVTAWTELVEFTTTAEPTCVINTIEITGFTEPAWGEHPDNEVTVPADADYTLGSAVWVSWDEANHHEEMMTTEDVFDNEDVVYYMYFQIAPKEGCTFVNPYYVTVTIDDNSEIVEGKNMDDGILYAWTEEYTVTAPCVINEANVNGYEPPVAGENSQDHLNITLPDNANYYLVESAYSPTWYDEDADDYFNGSFVGGTRYSVGVEIHANDGCVFANNCTFFFDDDENLVNPEFTGVDGEDNTIAYVWTMPELATGTTSPCEAPTGLAATNITATTATLDWTGNLEQYTVRYKDNAASDWTEVTTVNSTLALTGLTPATTYTAQVQGDCGSGAKSVTDWSEPVTFTTLSGTIEPGECGPAVDCEGTSYPTVKIGDVCWMAKNLAAETCVTTGNVYAYVNDQFPDEDANVETYGLLYDEEAAFATGLCPEGYTLPTTEQFEYLKNNFTVEELRNSTGWVVNTGTNGTGFSWDGSGFRNGTSETFEHMLMEGYLWAVDMTSGTPQPAMYKMMYYCNEIVRVYDFDGISASIRCVKNAEPQPEPEPEPEPEPFRCGTSNLKIGENSYETVLIGTQCWTKTNMREIVGEDATSSHATSIEDPLYYKVPLKDVALYGYLYNWKAATMVCPTGWHLPSHQEWITMEQGLTTEDVSSTETGEYGHYAGKLATTADWLDDDTHPAAPGFTGVYDDRNVSGFSAIPAGYHTNGFLLSDANANFWTSTVDETNSEKAYSRCLYYYAEYVGRYKHPKYMGESVRCVRDAEE